MSQGGENPVLHILDKDRLSSNCGSEGQAESRLHGGDINGKSCKANRFEYDSLRTEKEHSRNINNASESPQSKLVGTHIAKISFHFSDNESARLKIHQRKIAQMNVETQFF